MSVAQDDRRGMARDDEKIESVHIRWSALAHTPVHLCARGCHSAERCKHDSACGTEGMGGGQAWGTRAKKWSHGWAVARIAVCMLVLVHIGSAQHCGTLSQAQICREDCGSCGAQPCCNLEVCFKLLIGH